jgi:hypothetical protein
VFEDGDDEDENEGVLVSSDEDDDADDDVDALDCDGSDDNLETRPDVSEAVKDEDVNDVTESIDVSESCGGGGGANFDGDVFKE